MDRQWPPVILTSGVEAQVLAINLDVLTGGRSWLMAGNAGVSGPTVTDV